MHTGAAFSFLPIATFFLFLGVLPPAGGNRVWADSRWSQFANIAIVQVTPTSYSLQGGRGAECIVLRNAEYRSVSLDGWCIYSGKRKFLLDGIRLAAGGKVFLSTSQGASFLPLESVRVLTQGSLVSDVEWTVALCAPGGKLVSFVSSEDVAWDLSVHRGRSAVATHVEARFPPGALWRISDLGEDESTAVVDSVTVRSAYFRDAHSLVLRFSGPMDSTLVRQKLSYVLSSTAARVESVVVSDWYRRVELRLSSAFNIPERGLSLFAGLRDMEGKPLRQRTIPIYLLDTLLAPGLRVSEVMLKPTVDGAQFLELHNAGVRVIDLSRVSIAIGDRTPFLVARKQLLLEPDGLIVLSKKPRRVMLAHPSCPEETLVKVAKLPSFLQSENSVKLFNSQGHSVDHVRFSLQDLYYLAQEMPGISLERRTVEAIALDGKEWGTAKLSSSGATPGLPNSIWEDSGRNLVEREVIQACYHEGFPPARGRVDFYIDVPSASNVMIGIATIWGRVLILRNEILSEGGRATLAWDGFDEGGRLVQERDLVIFARVESPGRRTVRTGAVCPNPFFRR